MTHDEKTLHLLAQISMCRNQDEKEKILNVVRNVEHLLTLRNLAKPMNFPQTSKVIPVGTDLDAAFQAWVYSATQLIAHSGPKST